MSYDIWFYEFLNIHFTVAIMIIVFYTITNIRYILTLVCRFGKLSTAHIQRHLTNSSASLGFRIVGGKGSHQGDLPVVIKSISTKSE